MSPEKNLDALCRWTVAILVFGVRIPVHPLVYIVCVVVALVIVVLLLLLVVVVIVHSWDPAQASALLISPGLASSRLVQFISHPAHNPPPPPAPPVPTLPCPQKPCKAAASYRFVMPVASFPANANARPRTSSRVWGAGATHTRANAPQRGLPLAPPTPTAADAALPHVPVAPPLRWPKIWPSVQNCPTNKLQSCTCPANSPAPDSPG